MNMKAFAGRLLLGAIVTLAMGDASLAGQNDWTAHDQDPGNMRHSPLRQITPANVAQLAPASMQTGHHRPDGCLHDLGDLLVGQALDVR